MSTWKRTFAAVWLANTVTAIGMMAFLPFFPSQLEHLGLTDRDEIATWPDYARAEVEQVADGERPVLRELEEPLLDLLPGCPCLDRDPDVHAVALRGGVFQKPCLF